MDERKVTRGRSANARPILVPLRGSMIRFHTRPIGIAIASFASMLLHYAYPCHQFEIHIPCVPAESLASAANHGRLWCTRSRTGTCSPPLAPSCVRPTRAASCQQQQRARVAPCTSHHTALIIGDTAVRDRAVCKGATGTRSSCLGGDSHCARPPARSGTAPWHSC